MHHGCVLRFFCICYAFIHACAALHCVCISMQSKQDSFEDTSDEDRLRTLLYSQRALRKLVEAVERKSAVPPALAKSANAEADALNAELRACQAEMAEIRAKHLWPDNHIEVKKDAICHD